MLVLFRCCLFLSKRLHFLRRLWLRLQRVLVLDLCVLHLFLCPSGLCLDVVLVHKLLDSYYMSLLVFNSMSIDLLVFGLVLCMVLFFRHKVRKSSRNHSLFFCIFPCFVVCMLLCSFRCGFVLFLQFLLWLLLMAIFLCMNCQSIVKSWRRKSLLSLMASSFLRLILNLMCYLVLYRHLLYFCVFFL